MLRSALVASTLLLATALVPVSTATIDTAITADDLVAAAAGVALPGVTASFINNPGAPAHAVSDTPLGAFPTGGSTYAMLTTGDATIAPNPNTGTGDGLNLGGTQVRGDTDYDVTVLAIDFSVPEGGDCLGFDFQFLSEEYPEYVGTQFNDAFIAELDVTTWTTSGSTISAPDNFAFDENGDVISINSAGAATMDAAHAAGTTYDGATTLLRAQTPVTPGAHTLYLSIFDQGDQIYDSVVFIDNLSVGASGPSGCEGGVYVPTPPVAIADATPGIVNVGFPVTFDGTASFDPEEGPISTWSWATGPTTPTYTTSFDSPGTVCDTLTVFDSLGAAASDDACVDVTDELTVAVSTSKSEYGLTDNVKIHVDAEYVDGSPAAGAATGVLVKYRSGLGPADQLFVTIGCAPWTAGGTADESGRSTFTMPKAVLQSCIGIGGPGIVHLPSDLGRWSVTGSATDGANSGSDTASFGTTVLATLGL